MSNRNDLGNELAAQPKRANNINLADDLTRRWRDEEEEEADANQSST